MRKGRQGQRERQERVSHSQPPADGAGAGIDYPVARGISQLLDLQKGKIKMYFDLL